MKLFLSKSRKFLFSLVAFLLVFSVLLLSGCNNNYVLSPENDEETYELYKKEGYYTRFPIQVVVSEKFSEYNFYLIKESLIGYQSDLTGIKFETVRGPVEEQRDYSYIYINLDKKDKKLVQAYTSHLNGTSYGYSSSPKRLNHPKYSHSVATFKATITLGSFFTIGEDIPSEGIMSKIIHSSKYIGYDNYWSFFTKFATFKVTINEAFKGLIKHQITHALGYKGDSTTKCDLFSKCHSSDKNSLMYPLILGPDSTAFKKNKITDDIIAYLNNKYP